ncbi:MAG: protein translocase subunit SecD [Defluviitaleaceae bacterium]|nr:protein translocase subunit SecD [Defluviitaleaceae bacterium]
MKGKSLSALILIFVATVGLGLLAVFGLQVGDVDVFGVANIRQGLDLRGGVSILYEADEENPSSADMAAATNLLRNRLDSRGYLEATATQEGNRRIRVEIPGVEDTAAAVAVIGQTAMLTFHGVHHPGIAPHMWDWEMQDGEMVPVPIITQINDMGEVELVNVLLTGLDIARAQATTQQAFGGVGALQHVISLEFTAQGTQLFAHATTQYRGSHIVIALDGVPISWPTVNEPITTGQGVISGHFTRESARELAELITAGALPFRLEVISESHIGARLGEGALETSLWAGIIGLALVLIFMAVMYRSMGVCADWALMIYVILVLLLLSGLNVTLSLPAIAGIILSIGMAVDANVVIFERIRDEVAAGKTLKSALRMGYKRAMPAVIDSNVTTLIAGVVLFWLGTGPIMGFAQILIIGILVSMFTCLLVTRVLTVCLMNLGVIKIAHFRDRKKLFGKKADTNVYETDASGKNNEITEREPHPIVERRKWYFIFSASILTLGLVFMIAHSASGNGWFNLDVEFSGGSQFIVDMGQPFDNDDVEAIVRTATGAATPQVQQILGGNQVMIRIPHTTPETRAALIDAMSARYNLAAEDFAHSDVSAAVSAEMQRSALLAIGVASLAMLVYISIRFRDLRTGGSAVLAQLHDAFIVLCVYAILRIPLNYAFIAVMLTTLGYSINATIIIFDRMRENRTRMPKAGDASLINTSVTQTLRRTMISTVSTFLAVGMLYIIGVASIRDFTLPIIVGLLFGAYSSVLLSGSMWFMMRGKSAKKAK